MLSFFEYLEQEIIRFPSFIYTFYVCLAVSCQLFFSEYFLFLAMFSLLLLILLKRCLLRKSLIIGFLLFFVASAHIKGNYTFPELGENDTFGFGTFTVTDQVTRRNRTVYKGTLRHFYDSTGKLIAHNIPCSFSKKLPVLEGSQCSISGKLKQIKPYIYNLQVKQAKTYSPTGLSFSFARIRMDCKNRLSNWIRSHISSKRSQEFLAGISTGQFDDQNLVFELNRFGLQHIMAISGFHFAIVAVFFQLLLRFIFPPKIAAALLIMILSSYFVFLGPSPSILRAWLTIIIAFAAVLFERKPNSLNSLCLAVIAIVLYDPLMLTRIGFQFSVIVTLSILLNYPVIQNVLFKLIPSRRLSTVLSMSFLDQHIYCAASFLRGLFALLLAVNIVALPLSLFYFNKFPLMSLIYNLFFPLFVVMSIALLIMSMILAPIPLLSTICFSVNSWYNDMILNFVYRFPIALDYNIYYSGLNVYHLVVYYILVLALGFYGRFHMQINRKELMIMPDF